MTGTPPRSVRVSDDLWRDAQRAAESQGKTLTEVITVALRRYVKRHSPSTGAGGAP